MTGLAPQRGFVVALLGAESTGKTTLAHALHEALIGTGAAANEVAVVTEHLRAFCDAAGRTPRPDEQAAIAAEQTRRIDAAAAMHRWVLADTTALMTAVYHDQVFGDRSLYPVAESAHARADLTLLTALDLPWVADGLQRDGPGVREPVDAKLRAALARIARPYAIVHGTGPARVDAALRAMRRALPMPCDERGAGTVTPTDGGARFVPTAICERCGDPRCERRSLLPLGLSAAPPTPGPAGRAA